MKKLFSHNERLSTSKHLASFSSLTFIFYLQAGSCPTWSQRNPKDRFSNDIAHYLFQCEDSPWSSGM